MVALKGPVVTVRLYKYIYCLSYHIIPLHSIIIGFSSNLINN